MIPESVFKACLQLESVLQSRPELTAVVEKLCQYRLEGALLGPLAQVSPEVLATFLQEAEHLDFERIQVHRRRFAAQSEASLEADDVEPVRLVTLEEQRTRFEQDRQAGVDALQQGRFASVAFAGGSGTRFFSRLGELTQAIALPNEVLSKKRFDPKEPKGVFPISPVGGLSFYGSIIAEALHTGVRYGRLPWVLLLTSRVTHQQTLRFLSHSNLWGFPSSGWIAFLQQDEARLDNQGDLVVANQKGNLAWTGDGHGGVYRALLQKKGADSILQRLQAAGVEHLIMHNVDNAAARPFYPARLGFHVLQKALFTLSATRKVDPQEKVGVPMRLKRSGLVEVVEYNVLGQAISELVDQQTGRLVHEAGNINTNLVAVSAIRGDIEPTLYTGKVIDSVSGPIETSSLEMLNQHLTRLIDPQRVHAYEVVRDQFFMPTKNVTGPDSVATTIAMMSHRFAGLLRSQGSTIAPDALIDLHPACGVEEQELAAKGLGVDWEIGSAARVYLCAYQSKDSRVVGSEHLRVEDQASLIVDCKRPYGEISIDQHRNLHTDPLRASSISIGKHVTVKAARQVQIWLDEGAFLKIPDGYVFDKDVVLHLQAGQQLEL